MKQSVIAPVNEERESKKPEPYTEDVPDYVFRNPFLGCRKKQVLPLRNDCEYVATHFPVIRPSPSPSPSPSPAPKEMPFAVVSVDPINPGEINARFDRLEKRLADLEEANKVLTANEAVYQVTFKQYEARLREKDEKHAEIQKMTEGKYAALLKEKEENFALIMLEKDDRCNDMIRANNNLMSFKDEVIESLQGSSKRARK